VFVEFALSKGVEDAEINVEVLKFNDVVEFEELKKDEVKSVEGG